MKETKHHPMRNILLVLILAVIFVGCSEEKSNKVFDCIKSDVSAIDSLMQDKIELKKLDLVASYTNEKLYQYWSSIIDPRSFGHDSIVGKMEHTLTTSDDLSKNEKMYLRYKIDVLNQFHNKSGKAYDVYYCDFAYFDQKAKKQVAVNNFYLMDDCKVLYTLSRNVFDAHQKELMSKDTLEIIEYSKFDLGTM